MLDAQDLFVVKECAAEAVVGDLLSDYGLDADFGVDAASQALTLAEKHEDMLEFFVEISAHWEVAVNA